MNDKLEQLKSAILAGQVPQMVLNMISYALEQRASDIHIEPSANKVRVRYRIDGVLRLVVEYPSNMHPAVVSRIKIMSNLKIDEQRIPQDGRSQVTTKDNREMDLRISTLPTVNGEKVVMRIQDKSREIPTLVELGLTGNSLKFLQDGLKDPNGIILTSGPTGSGKTTTLYSCLNILNKMDVNILTIEDPVEIEMEGLNQSQVHPDIDYTFATGLRSALRQDPDIVMVGEIRDHETINVAIEASLTGHLVLSTIHTNSATETLTRIINMGVQPFLMASTINTIIAQRLVRKLCDQCKKQISIEQVKQNDPDLYDNIMMAFKSIPASEKANYPELAATITVIYEPVGCAACDNVGYHGRFGLYEVMDINNTIREAILVEKTSLQIQELAQEEGMITLEQAGLIKMALGETSMEEVYRVARRSSQETGKHMEEEHTEMHIDAPVVASSQAPVSPIAASQAPVSPIASFAAGAPVSPPPAPPVPSTLEITLPENSQASSPQ
ncbi:type II secretion system protein E [Candidatus Peregrinibacteria bacterium CG11_big_fil_rev_8_21_14_0_20_41_10]|nr:MAG: type II secretion system protein E [Candidatus Peregrinibacteria bacterium CG11_big_fil_rev_8_21_14_0_20_41_10]PIZ74581.1 MAG: type II secretion system protein E [Candidatus Peregrinibacteria bacterium CG_4_10_14_0_2_um_filter_41_8]PJC38111.1 MAG: type II secretion system protein E [Candidatus Peregrinibacteria bacterium CG_4_9_14_0_2_um_filter_41_14]